MIMRKLLLIFLFACCTNAFAIDFIVTNTNDNGTGSLRNAIIQANASPSGSHQILFNIPTSDINFNSTQGTWTILPLSAMPYITKGNISIDGTSQTINQGNTNSNGPEIILDGNRTVDFAFHIFNVSNVIIKGFVICNFTYGIQISQMTANASQYNVIKGNYIGTNYNASDTAGNSIGIEIIGGPQYNTIGGTQIADRNIVSGNNHIGIRIVNANNNIIINNYVGTDRTGTYALRNYDGISIEGTAKYNVIGGYTVAERNLVSGNVAYGIPVFGAGCDNNVIIGNYIGSDISGSYKIPNTYGVLYDDGAKFNLLGGKKQGAGNLISGNSGYGVFIYNNSTNSDTVTGNLIGTTANGMDSLSNTIGIVIDGIPRYHIVDSNVISGNRQSGIVLHATGTDFNVITRNKIGTAIDGISPLPNKLDGIRIGEGPRKNMIGMPEKGNIIAFNGGNGITIMNDGDYYNKISANSIHHNAGLGIDLYPMGITNNDAGDADIGPNMLMNFPVITYAAYNEASEKFLIEGYIETQLSQYSTIELFKSDDDASGFGEGEIYLASVVPDNTGNFSVEITSGIWGGTKVTATATDSSGNTSEFSASTHVSKVPVFIFNEEKIHVFPNPAINDVNIILTNYIGNIQLNILNLQGEKILNESFFVRGENYIKKINVHNLESGIYFVMISNKKEKHSLKIVVLK